MAAFNGATDLVSETIEDAFLEIAEKLVMAQNDPEQNPDEIDNVQVSYSTTGLANINGSIRVAKSVDTNGHIVMNAVEYLDV